jgi:leucyl/phenylalanyl-tRNA---protein transferase
MMFLTTALTGSTMQLIWLDSDPSAVFPSVTRALREPDGLLAAGGDLSSTRLLNAYKNGIFPWFSAGQPILWWSPDPRMVFRTDAVHLSKKFRQQLKKSNWEIRADTCFKQVIQHCATVPREGQGGTWIHADMIAAYCALNALGHAHSVEVFSNDHLIGGIYGVAIGKMFFGESMFSLQSGGSKAALAGLANILKRWHWPLIDAQVENSHLQTMGAQFMPRGQFIEEINALCQASGISESWRNHVKPFPATDCLTPIT